MVDLDHMAWAGIEEYVEFALGTFEAESGIVLEFARDQHFFVIADHVQRYPGRATAVGKSAGADNFIGGSRLALADGVVGQRQGRDGHTEQHHEALRGGFHQRVFPCFQARPEWMAMH